MVRAIPERATRFTVSHGVAKSVVVFPDSAAITAVNSEIYSAVASDAFNNSWDATDSVTLSISSGAGGSWSNNTYTSAIAGFWTVTADNGAGVTGTATLEVTPGALAQFVFSPIDSSQTAGNSFSLAVTAVDSYGNIVTSYSGPAYLSDTSGSISPTITRRFCRRSLDRVGYCYPCGI